ncbi:MAG: Cytidylyltransferase family protein [Candidatus Methanofastidiosum methylothiophilum]|uniref:Cytidylyltransferase family protein n=1 Tax=Candidatus Methanofastidiosum methylothiophilum TaxID=1705564 RepID=A0A150IUW6_9EURY|nr:MAG: Cytidylyltransferase family protein [Candidatus Methanofastidiosum methylthiophilus]KYC48655.1 MAG: Cytidylyltransferase family protein [Candidatus Methanofastidiosum methylthiophilus]KYC51140.1 MAG: Cytidylyltransferase family protein [Candidatus Methanofastidiosum methylthiophilus]
MDSELRRKIFHEIGLLIPISYLFFDKKDAIFGMSILVIIFVFVEFLRLRYNFGTEFIPKVVGKTVRDYEEVDLSAATYFIISSFFTVLLFEKFIAIAAISYNSIGDFFSAIIGKRFGKIKYMGGKKSLEGSIACFVSCFIVGLFVLNPLMAIAGALAATFAEGYLIKVNDNLSIPILSGIVLTAISFL